MAIDFLWSGPTAEPASGLRIAARCTSDDPVTIALSDGQSATLVPDADLDFVVVQEFSELTAGTRYTATATQAGSSAQITPRTARSTGTVRIGWCSCIGQGRSHFPSAFELVDTHDVDLVLLQDDYPYLDLDLAGYGETHVGIGTDPTDLPNFWSGHRYIRKVPGSAHLNARTPFSWMPGDHGFIGEDWDFSPKLLAIPNKANGVYAYLEDRLPTAEEVIDFWKIAGVNGCAPYYQSNPTNTDDNVEAEDPPTADATGITNNGGTAACFPPRYHRMRFGTLLEIFVLDPHSHCDLMETAAGASKTTLGTIQKQWLKDQLAASPCTFKAISVATKLFRHATDNYHLWESMGSAVTITSAGQPDHPTTFQSAGYEHERTELLDFIEAADGWAVPGGVFWLHGDRHVPAVYTSPDHDHVGVCACPESNDVNESQGATRPDSVLWWDAHWNGSAYSGGRQCYGVVEVNAAYAELSIHVLGRGRIWSGRIEAGSNALTYPRTRFG